MGTRAWLEVLDVCAEGWENSTEEFGSCFLPHKVSDVHLSPESLASDFGDPQPFGFDAGFGLLVQFWMTNSLKALWLIHTWRGLTVQPACSTRGKKHRPLGGFPDRSSIPKRYVRSFL